MKYRKTFFGAAMSIATIIAFIGLGLGLFINNVLFPIYTASVSPQPPPWVRHIFRINVTISVSLIFSSAQEPRGIYELSVVVRGGGLDSCVGNNAFSIFSVVADWNTAPSNITNVFNPMDGSCQLVWRCQPQCTMLNPQFTTLELRSPPRAWASFFSYSLSVPMFASRDAIVNDFGSLPYRLAGAYYAPPDPTSNLTAPGSATALRGATPTTIGLLVTPVIVNSSSSATLAPAKAASCG